MSGREKMTEDILTQRTASPRNKYGRAHPQFPEAKTLRFEVNFRTYVRAAEATELEISAASVGDRWDNSKTDLSIGVASGIIKPTDGSNIMSYVHSPATRC